MTALDIYDAASRCLNRPPSSINSGSSGGSSTTAILEALLVQRGTGTSPVGAPSLTQKESTPLPQALLPHQRLSSTGFPTKGEPKVLQLPNGLLVKLATNEDGLYGSDKKKAPYTLTLLDPVKKTPVALGSWHTSGGCFRSASTQEVTALPLTLAELEALVAPPQGEAFTLEAGELGAFTLQCNTLEQRLNVAYSTTEASRKGQRTADNMGASGAFYAQGPSSFSPLRETEIPYGQPWRYKLERY